MLNVIKRWKIRDKMIAAYGTILLIAIAVSIYGSWSMHDIKRYSRQLERWDFEGLIFSIEIEEGIRTIEKYICQLVNEMGTPATQENICVLKEKLDILISKYSERFLGETGLVDETFLKAGLRELKVLLNRYVEEAEIIVKTKIENSEVSMDFLKKDLKVMEKEILVLISDLRNEEISRVSLGFSAIDNLASNTQSVNLILIIVTVLLTFFVTYKITEMIAISVMRLVKGTEKVSRGDLSYKVKIDSNDEFGQLASSFNKMTENLQLAYDQLIQSEKMQAVGQLASGVAHEVKNPLGIILLGAKFLEKKFKNGKEDEYVINTVKTIVKSVKRADDIIRGLVDFSGQSSLNMVKEDLNAIIEVTLPLIQHGVKQKGITIIRDFQDNLPPVRVDMRKMEQVFINLIMNAIHAMQNGGQITLRTYSLRVDEISDRLGQEAYDIMDPEHEIVVAEICDSGSGIDEDDLKNIFNPFFTKKKPGEGTGLGLSVTRSIIMMHKGFIKIESEKGKGTKATVAVKVAGGADGGEKKNLDHR
ncbi:MAG: HAMP domain-containing protein [Candidatus Omnitrophica bacterium]|nr:HAMP domain-containing protein [Candidatus Omnitrophota bacterium]